jgi:hypothetical protein
MSTRLTLALGLATATSSLFGHPPGEHGHPGDVRAADTSQVTIEVRDGYRWITSNGMPDHATGQFPNSENPGRIQEQSFHFRVALTPRVSEKPVDLGPSGPPPDRWGENGRGHGQPPILFGAALNGVVFDPGTAEWWNNDATSGWHVDALGPTTHLGVDEQHAHVQPPTGTYHYHGVPTALVARLAGDQEGKKMVLVGWAADGYPVYALWGYSDANDPTSAIKTLRPSYRLKSGARPRQENGPSGSYDGTYVEDYEYVPGLGDLDEFNGRAGPTPEFPDGTYYYVLSARFPAVPRQLKGVPDESFRKGPPAGRGGGRPGQRNQGAARGRAGDTAPSPGR